MTPHSLLFNVSMLPADKHEYGMVGGHWEPQDGGHPASDPTTLTRTAVRTFKAATGLDLSSCTQARGCFSLLVALQLC